MKDKNSKKFAKTEQVANTASDSRLSRRQFISSAAATATAFTIVPRHVLGGPGQTPPSEKLNIAGIGIGGRGWNDLQAVDSENIIALCDVDFVNAQRTFELFPKAKKYYDFREMLDKEKSIDAVMVATPDHTHATATMAAMQLGKHVYCQKPMTRTIYEARRLTEAAREYKLATQMGIQAHADDAERIGVEVVKSGIIGKVREVHAWTDRPAWPQECERPKEAQTVPSTLRWDLWIGPAEFRPFNRAYHDFRWRGWWDFGTGALGDMGCHVIDPAFWALDLKYPISVESVRTELGWWQDTTFPETGPIASIIRLEFPARGDQPPVTLTWYDGGLRPLRPEEMEEGRNLPGNGVLYVGDKGKILSPYEQGPRLLPESKMKDFKPPEPTLPRGKDNYKEWLDACKGGTPGLANFDYAGPLTETVLLGVVALRAHPGKKFTWDGEKMKVTNDDNANEYIYPHYKNGWTL